MKVTVKNVKQQAFEIEADESSTVADVKEKLSGQGVGDAALQKLIYQGKVLKDSDTLSAIGFDEAKFMVVMVARAKAAPVGAPAAAAASPAPSVAPAATPTPAQEAAATPAAPEPAAATETAAAEAGSPNYENAASTLVTGSHLDNTISNICEMGFERAQVERAMRAAFNNPDRAVEYLMSGIPPGLEAAANAQQAQRQPAAASGAQSAATQPAETPAQAAATEIADAGAVPDLWAAADAADEGDGQAQDFEWLRNHPQFDQMRQLILSNPSLLPQIATSIAQTSPEAAQAIQADPQGFMAALMGQEMMQSAAAQGAGGQGGMQVAITPEEREAVERLAGLGFDFTVALQAYLAMDKNEEMAANYLFEHGADLVMSDDEGAGDNNNQGQQ